MSMRYEAANSFSSGITLGSVNGLTSTLRPSSSHPADSSVTASKLMSPRVSSPGRSQLSNVSALSGVSSGSISKFIVLAPFVSARSVTFCGGRRERRGVSQLSYADS